MPAGSDTAVVTPGVRVKQQQQNEPIVSVVDGDDQGASDEVITYEDEGENDAEMELGCSLGGVGVNGDLLISQASDLMADIKNSLVNETNASSCNDLQNPTGNGFDLKALRLGGFDAATLAASGLSSLAAAAAASGVNGGSFPMGGLHFSPYGSLPPPLLPYSHLSAASKLYSPFAGISGLQLPTAGLDPKSSTGALSMTNAGGVNSMGGVSGSSPLLTATSCATSYNTAAVSAALSNWAAAAVSPRNARINLPPPPGLSPDALASLNPLHNSSGQHSGASSASSPLAMFAAHMFNGVRGVAPPVSSSASSASGVGQGVSSSGASNPYHQLLAAVSGTDITRNGSAFHRGPPFGASDVALLQPHPSNLMQHPGGNGGEGMGMNPQHPNGVRTNVNGSTNASSDMMDQSNTPHIKEKSLKNSKPYVKKPLNAFMLFMKENREKVMQESTLKESAAINQILGRKWHELEKTEQNRYYDMAKNERQAHQRLHPSWSARDNYATSKHRKRRKRSLSGYPGEGLPHDPNSDPLGMRELGMDAMVHNGFMGGENHLGLSAEQAQALMEGRPMPPNSHQHNMLTGIIQQHRAPGVQLSGVEGQGVTEMGGVSAGSGKPNSSVIGHSITSMVASSNSQETPNTHSNVSSEGATDPPESASKKCRARFGLEQQESWCKHCRRKKKCSVFRDNEDSSHTSNSTTNNNNNNSGTTNTSTPPNKEKKTTPNVTPKVLKFQEQRIARNSTEDESPGFNTDSLASIKNELVSSLTDPKSTAAATSHSDYPLPSKRPRNETEVSPGPKKSRNGSAVKSGKLEISRGSESESDIENDSSESEDCLSISTVVKNGSSNSGKDKSLSSVGSMPSSQQGKIIAHLNNNHINSLPTNLASLSGLSNGLVQSLDVQSTGSPSSGKDINVLSPLMDSNHTSTLNNNISSLGAIKQSPNSLPDISKASHNLGGKQVSNTNTNPTHPNSLMMNAVSLSQLATSAANSTAVASAYKSGAHIPFAFSPFNPNALTSVSNSTTPNSPFSPLQPSSAALAAAASVFSAGTLFAAASGAANASTAAPPLPFSSFFPPSAFTGSSFPAFKDGKDTMVSMALSSTSPATASQS